MRFSRKEELFGKIESNQQAHSGLRRTPSALRGAPVTTLNLNKQPIPKQPVPDLKQTAERYLRYNTCLYAVLSSNVSLFIIHYRSLKPLLTDNEYKNTERIVGEFISHTGAGPRLHAKLLERYQNTDNWVLIISIYIFSNMYISWMNNTN